MYDNFGGPGFDWSGNGRYDAFDDYMNMEAAGGSGAGRGQGAADGKGPRINQKKPSGGIVIYDSTKDSDGIALVKALTVCGLCILGFAVPVSVGMGDLGTILWMGGCIGLSVKVLKNG